MSSNGRMLKFLAVLTLGALLFIGLLSGCGSKTTQESEEVAAGPTPGAPAAPAEAAPETTPAAPAETPDLRPTTEPETAVEIDDWRNPADLSLLLERFRELEWVWTNTAEGTEQETTTIRYRLIGDESVDGKDATRIELVVHASVWDLWLDVDGSVLQAVIDGEALAPEMSNMVVGAMLVGVFWPFTMVDAYEVEEVVSGGGPGWEMTRTDVGRRTYGDLSADVHEYRVTVAGPPHMEAGESSTLVWTIADFGTFQMLAEWHVLDGDAAEAFRMEILRVVPR